MAQFSSTTPDTICWHDRLGNHRPAKTLEELRHIIGDMLDTTLSDAQLVPALLKRVNGGATLEHLLQAAMSVARERQDDRILELEEELEDAKRDLDKLGDTLRRVRKTLAEHES